MPRIRLFWTAAAAIALAACVPRTAAPAPAPAPISQPMRAPPPTPAPPPPADWQDGPLSPGDWNYGQSSGPRASFGAEGPLFVVECTSGRQIALARIGVATGPTLAIRTDYGERSLPVSGQPPAAIATIAAADPLLDEIAFSRGRFLVRVGGLPDLILPSWPELARVVEDCRE